MRQPMLSFFGALTSAILTLFLSCALANARERIPTEPLMFAAHTTGSSKAPTSSRQKTIATPVSRNPTQRIVGGRLYAETQHKHKEDEHKEKEPKHAKDDGHDHAKSKQNGDDHKHSEPKPSPKSKKDHDHGHGEAGHAHKETEPAGHDEDQHKHRVGDKKKHGHQDEEVDDDHNEPSGDGHDHGSEAQHSESVKLTPEQMKEFGVATTSAAAGPIAKKITRPAEVKYNQALLAHVVPRVAGIVVSVSVEEGERVKEDQIVATLDSRELADAKAGYLAAVERRALAEKNFEREKTLMRKNITSEKSFLAAKTALAETRITMRSSEQKLHALGFDEKAIKKFVAAGEANLTLYTMRAPLTGVVVQRHLVRGESVGTDREVFTIADVSSVWVDVTIFPRDLVAVKAGMPVRIKTDDGLRVSGSIKFVSPNLSEATRTAVARVVLENKDMSLRPGMFVKGEIDVSQRNVAVRIPKLALQNHEGKQVVFVAENGKFEARPVTLGKRGGEYVEVVSGLTSGEAIVSRGAFLIKSQLSKESFGDGHNH